MTEVACLRAQVDTTLPSAQSSWAANSADPDDASSSSASDSDPIAYTPSRSPSPTSSRLPPTGEGFTTHHGKDYRPKSSFYLKPWSEMTHAERVCHLATCPEEMHKIVPESVERGPIPTQSMVRENAFILSRAMVPLAIQAASYWAFPNFKWPLGLAYPFYVISFMGFALAVMARLNHYCVKLGTFDEKHISRDRTPDNSVNGLAKGITAYMLLRTGMAFYLYYNKAEAPLSTFTWTYPLRLAAWELVFDYFFYAYHRSSHEVESLWFIHQHHHTTKHPTAILAILAGDYQECLEIAIIPLAATVVIPMSFAELYLTLCYTIYVEMLGHSGVRSNWTHPVLWVLKPFDCELAVEDHDLHHRHGKSGKNYGKQSRFWDKIFGTVGARIETKGM